ncbi:MAG TPA: CBS domain-containing protein [Anaerolineales bacterium]|nr:CBS domain-containing protein [Anaerolineales bacterium]
MYVKSCMKTHVVSVLTSTTIREAAAIFASKHIGTLPIVDKNNRPLGIIGIHDLLKLEMPDFIQLVVDVDFVHDFGAVEDTRPSAATLKKTVRSLMRPVVTVEEDCGLLRAYAMMLQQNLHDIPVVSKDGKLVGIASRVDIGVMILKAWEKVE